MAAPRKLPEHLISNEVTAFIVDRRARKLSPATISFYQHELDWFLTWLREQGLRSMPQISADVIRKYLIDLGLRRNENGCHASYRALKAFLKWYADELDDPSYLNPIRKVQSPKINADPKPGVSMEHILALLDTCQRSFMGQRDRAIFLVLLDTGLRKAEFIKLDYGDIDLRTGAIQVRAGKGRKDRTIFAGNRARRELIRYLRYRGDLSPASPLWVTQTGTRLTAAGLRQIIRRRAEAAGIPTPEIHDFRRAFALQSLRNGINLVALMRLMGHTDTKVLQRYLDLVSEDLQLAHAKGSPADNL